MNPDPQIRKAIYADALLLLIRAGEIVKGEGEKAMVVLGLDWDDMRAARQRADRATKGLNHPITPVGPETPPPGPPTAAPRRPTVVPQQYHPHASRRRATKDGQFWCAGHDDKAGAWLDPGEFDLRSDREPNGARKSWCRSCTRDYQRKRYLSVSQVAEHVIALRYVQSPAEPDACCCRCGHPIDDGEEVEVVGTPAHARCVQGEPLRF